MIRLFCQSAIWAARRTSLVNEPFSTDRTFRPARFGIRHGRRYKNAIHSCKSAIRLSLKKRFKAVAACRNSPNVRFWSKSSGPAKRRRNSPVRTFGKGLAVLSKLNCGERPSAVSANMKPKQFSQRTYMFAFRFSAVDGLILSSITLRHDRRISSK